MTQPFLCGRYTLDLQQPQIMGIVNVTPDSFSDGGRHNTTAQAIAHAQRLIAEGAHILDLGGESTRPGAPSVSAAEELARLLPVIDGLRDCGVPLSVDTQKPEVMQAVLAHGVDIINDIQGFRSPEALAAVADSRCGLIVMHMQGEPASMQAAPAYDDAVSDVVQWLAQQVERLRAAGVTAERIVLDPGLGFGKRLPHNIALLEHTPRLLALGYPVLIGLSRKTMIGEITGRPVDQRLAGSLAGALRAVARGARIVRVHDVAATADALAVWNALSCENPS